MLNQAVSNVRGTFQDIFSVVELNSRGLRERIYQIVHTILRYIDLIFSSHNELPWTEKLNCDYERETIELETRLVNTIWDKLRPPETSQLAWWKFKIIINESRTESQADLLSPRITESFIRETVKGILGNDPLKGDVNVQVEISSISLDEQRPQTPPHSRREGRQRWETPSHSQVEEEKTRTPQAPSDRQTSLQYTIHKLSIVSKRVLSLRKRREVQVTEEEENKCDLTTMDDLQNVGVSREFYRRNRHLSAIPLLTREERDIRAPEGNPIRAYFMQQVLEQIRDYRSRFEEGLTVSLRIGHDREWTEVRNDERGYHIEEALGLETDTDTRSADDDLEEFDDQLTLFEPNYQIQVKFATRDNKQIVEFWRGDGERGYPFVKQTIIDPSISSEREE